MNKEANLFGDDDFVEQEQEKDLFGDVEMTDVVEKTDIKVVEETLEDAIFGGDIIATANTPVVDEMEVDQVDEEENEIPEELPVPDEEEEKASSIIEDKHITFPVHPYPLQKENIAAQLKLSNGISFAAKVYNGDIDDENEVTAMGAIRWRYNTKNNEKVIESNARLLEWEDGTYSLAIGDELLDFLPMSTPENQTTFTAVHDADVYSVLYDTNAKYSLKPVDRQSRLNKSLRKQRHVHSQRRVSAKEILVNEDPEAAVKAAEEAELQKERMLRKMEKKREKKGQYEEEQFEEEFQADYSGEDSYDEADDFVVADNQQVDEFDEDDLEKELEDGADEIPAPKKQKTTVQSNIVFSSDDE